MNDCNRRGGAIGPRMEDRHGEVMMSHLGRDSQGQINTAIESDSCSPLITSYPLNGNESLSCDEGEYCIRPNNEAADVDESAEEDSSGFFSNMSPYASSSNRSICNDDRLMKTESGSTLHNETGSFSSDIDVSDVQNNKSSATTPGSLGEEPSFSTHTNASHDGDSNDLFPIPIKIFMNDNEYNNMNIENIASEVMEDEDKSGSNDCGKFVTHDCERGENISNCDVEECGIVNNVEIDAVSGVEGMVSKSDSESSYDSVCESTPVKTSNKIFLPLQCNLIKLPSFKTFSSPIEASSFGEASGGKSPGICCDSAAQCDQRNTFIFGPARNVQDFGEVDRKFSVNEFGDTIGICEAVNDVFCSGVQVFEGGNLFDRSFTELRKASPENSYSNGESSLVSLNTHLMDILTDLDDVLEKSLMENSGLEDVGNGLDLKLERIVESDDEVAENASLNLPKNSSIRDPSPSPTLEDELCRLSDIKLEIIEPITDEGLSSLKSCPANLNSAYDDEACFFEDLIPEVSCEEKPEGECDIESGKSIDDLESTDKHSVDIEHSSLAANKTWPNCSAAENCNNDYICDSHMSQKDSENLVKLLEPSALSHDVNFSHVIDVGTVTLNRESKIVSRDKENENSVDLHLEIDADDNQLSLIERGTPSKLHVEAVERRSEDDTELCNVEEKYGFTETNFENELEEQKKEAIVSKCKRFPNSPREESSLKIDTLPSFALSKMIHTQRAGGDGNVPQEAEENDDREGASESGLRVKRVGSRDSSPDSSSVGRLQPNEAVMRERRDSMRLARPLELPSAPPHSRSTSPDPLTLPVLLFMETHSPEYSPARQINPSSSAPRVYGRRGQTDARLSLSNNNNNDTAASVVVAGVDRRDSRRAWRSSGANRTRSSSASSGRAARSVSSDSSSLSSNETSAAVTPRRSTTCTDSRPQAEESAGSNGTTSSSRSSDPAPETEAKTSDWPHGLSSMLACLGCTVGVFNISRFSILSVHFGANFMVQFLVLSLAIGIPLFLVHVCLGRAAGAGPLAVWKVSPLLRGIGAAMLLAQVVIGTYSVVGLTWLFVYFRDSFVTNVDRYRWAEPFGLYRDDVTVIYNGSYKLAETIPDYFNGVVLKRHNLASPDNSFGTVKFQLTFNLAVVWMIVFVALSKGLRSYGKVVYVFAFLPICCTLILCAKLLSLTPHDSVYDVFPETSWNEFFINSKSWSAAAQEAFLTWGLLGACAMQLTSHGVRRIGPGKPDSSLRRDCLCLILLTFSILLLAAFLANTCVHILAHHGYMYSTGSFEDLSSYTFLTPRYNPLPSSLGTTPPRHMWHHCNLMGMHVTRPGSDPSAHSGYQLLQLATELVPSTLAIVGPEEVSSFWAVLFYFILILFGLAQQLAIWHCVITGIMAINNRTLKSWETTITFFSCAFGFVLGLPLTTDTGVSVIHFIDYVIVGIWWNCLLHVALLCGMFLVRGRPFSGEAVVGMLYSRASAVGPLLCFTWNVLLPVALIALCVVDFRVGKYRQLYTWRRSSLSSDYWPLWCKRLGAALQLIPLVTVVFIGFIQTCRYLGSGPPDILERIQLLYRPHVDGPGTSPPVRNNNNNRGAPRPGDGAADTSRVPEPSPDTVLPDPPPKYTPPPSYSTATGARIAKVLRHSIRRSIRGVRRLAISLGESSMTTPQIPMSISETISRQTPAAPVVNSPPDYSVLLTNQNVDQTTDISPADATYITDLNHTADITRNEDEFVIPDLIPVEQDIASGFDHRFSSSPSVRAYQSFNSGSSLQRSRNDGKATTACDVANLLRSSVRRSVRIRTLPSSFDGSLSQECLLNQVEPVSNTTVNVINENRDSNGILSSPRLVRQPGMDIEEERTSVI